MKTMLTLVASLISFSVLAQEFTVKDVLCGTFGYDLKSPCMLIISDDSQEAGVLLESKFVMIKVTDVKELIGQKVKVDLDALLMVTLEEEENIRGFIDYPEAKYFSASSKEFKFLQ